MKKFLTLGLVAVLGTALVTGCKKKEEAAPAEATKEAPAVVEETATTGTATTSTGTMGTMGTETGTATTGTATTGTATTSTATTTTKTN